MYFVLIKTPLLRDDILHKKLHSLKPKGTFVSSVQ